MNMRSQGRQKRCVAVAICLLLLLSVALATALTSDSVLAAAGRDSAWVGDWSTIGSSSFDQGWFTSATGIAVDNSNNDATRGTIYVADPNGHYLRVRAPGATSWGYLCILNDFRPTDHPWDVAVDKEGNLYVVNGVGYGLTEMVWKYKPSTKEWTDLTHGYTFYYPRGIAVDNSGSVYVANTTIPGDYSSYSAVVKLSPNSSSWEVLGDYENHGFLFPTGIAADGDGNLYVTHHTSGWDCLSMRAAGGTSWTPIIYSNPGIEFRGVTADRFGNIYWVAGNALRMIEKDSNDKVTIKQTPDGYFNIPCGIATDIDGGVYLTDNDLTLIMAHDGWVKKLAWVTQPGGGAAGESLSPQPAVYLAGAGGQIITGISGIEVTATLNNANGAVLSSSTATMVNGVATFSNLSVDRPGTYTLSCTCSLQSETITVVDADGTVYMKPTAAISSAGSSPFTVTAPPPAAAPTASPASGTRVARGWAITLASATPGATIRYTTDGSNPGPGSPGGAGGTEVTVTGELGGAFTIKAYASAEGWSDSPISTFTYSIYSADNYTVTFIDGGVLYTTRIVPAGTAVGSATWPAPSKTGYTFNGWYTAVAGGTEFTAGTIVEADTTVYARYLPISYNLSYQLNGGTVSPANPLNYSIESDDFTLNNPTRVHYEFAGWSGPGIPEGEKSFSVTIPQGSVGDRSFTAHWEPVSYSISYDLAGGAADPANPESYTVETASFTLQNPTRSGYTFAGWSGTGIPEGEQPSSVTITKGSSGARTYTAHWTAINYSIDYNLNGGSAANPNTYTVESSEITLNNPTRAHYDFTGWTGTDLGDDPSPNVTIAQGSAGNRSYTAHWEPVSYSIDYYLKGGAVDPPNPESYTVETEEITLQNPTRPGYTFAGWSGTGIPEGEQHSSVTIARGSSGARAYTAHWTAINYSISYELAGGSAANPESYTVESDEITLNDPTRAHYDFTGWTGTGIEGDPSPSVTIAQGSLGDRSYTAHWEPVSYSIDYDLKGGAVDPANPESYT
ncbi:MAG: hypothetical protein GX881_09410, partial [Firmicutes bacterium]|nr:hypothetical protein [Bacillota bacterium]